MAVRRLCVEEITDVFLTESLTVTCDSPQFEPVGPGNPPKCNVALYNVAYNTAPVPTVAFSYDVQFKYSYLTGDSVTFEAFCTVTGQSGSITFDSDVSLCQCQQAFSIDSSATCDASQITTTPTSVSGPVTFNFTLNNLCAQTILCVEDTTCL